MFGRIMPDPFANPLMLTCELLTAKLTEANFGRVSVVNIPCAADCQELADNAAYSSGNAQDILSLGNCSPITPVENGNICSDEVPAISANPSQHAIAASSPLGPVPAFAYPVLIKK